MTEFVCDPLDLSSCAYAGDSVVTTDKGSIETADTGVMQIFPTGVGEFTTTAESTSGTLRYNNASSVFVATGELNFITGEAVGEYTLRVCHGGQ